MYLIGLLRVAHNANCVRLAVITHTSHDGLSRVLKRAVSPVLFQVTKTLFKTLEKISVGYLIIDDTTINKEYARIIERCYWLWSTNGSRYIFGYNIVVLMWSNGTVTIPLSWAFYKKETEKKNQITKIAIALELMAYAKKRCVWPPQRLPSMRSMARKQFSSVAKNTDGAITRK